MMKWIASAKFSEDIIDQFGLPWSKYRAQVAEAYAQRIGFENVHVVQPYLLREKRRDHSLKVKCQK